MTALYSTNTLTNAGVKVIVHGPAKIGKTVLASTCPKPVILSSERGLLSLRKFNIPVMDINSMQGLRDAWKWVSASKEARQFSTIFIDSVTDIAEMVLREVKSKTKDGRAAYGETQDEIANLLRYFRDLSGPHVVFVFQSEFYEDKALGTTVFIPTVPGNVLKQKISYITDEIFFMFAGKNPDGSSFRALRTQPDYRTAAGDRSGALAEIEPPHLGHIFDKIAKG